MLYPFSRAEVTVDASSLRDGDVAGICALQGAYALAGITRERDRYYLVMKAKEADDLSVRPLDSGFRGNRT
ncbi:MAG: hypothetical protein U5K84_10525 [Alkalibacterium sp.]|nr:hypothetical protein [Alkalibacterium sp.]